MVDTTTTARISDDLSIFTLNTDPEAILIGTIYVCLAGFMIPFYCVFNWVSFSRNINGNIQRHLELCHGNNICHENEYGLHVGAVHNVQLYSLSYDSDEQVTVASSMLTLALTRKTYALISSR